MPFVQNALIFGKLWINEAHNDNIFYMKELNKNPLFILGLFLRLCLLAFILPKAAADWYIPFMDASLHHFSLDPWHNAIQAGVSALSFPYGYIMWLIFLPLCALSAALGIALSWGYGLTLLTADFALLLTLKRLLKVSNNTLLAFYWLSPIVLFATYWLGLNDLIPVCLLCLSLLQIKHQKALVAGLLCGAAVSAKLSMILALPFFFIYLFQNKNLRIFLKPYLIGLFIALMILALPFLYSHDGLIMLLNNPEMHKIYDMAIPVGQQVILYLLPMAYLLTTYLAWRIRRISFDLFFVLLGIAFFLVLLLSPASPGWFLWVMPLFIFYQAMSGRTAAILIAGFSILYILVNTIIMPFPLNGLLQTILFTFGIILIMRIWREAVRKNNYFRLSRRPFIVGVAGDSGAGKDTLVASLVELFGTHSVATVSGDDYHFWDRHKPMWQVMTHLNPMANDLEKFAQDILDLADGKNIQARHYDHHDGKKSKPRRIKTNDFIIASGLHALYLPLLRETYDLRIYLDMDESLRHYLKIQRDVHERGHSLEKVLASIEKREADSAAFIRPQAESADLVLSLQAIHPRLLQENRKTESLHLKLIVRARHGMHENSLVRVLVGICGLHVDINLNGNNAEIELIIEGDTSAEDIALAAEKLLPEMTTLLDVKPIWKDGIQGLIQLIVLSHIHQALGKRLL